MLFLVWHVAQQAVVRRRWPFYVYFAILTYKCEESGCRSVLPSKPATCARSGGVNHTDYVHGYKLLMNFR